MRQKKERGNRFLNRTNSVISFAHSFRGRRFLLRSLATGFSLAGTFALAKESSCPTPRRAPLRRSFRLLRVSKIPPPTSSSRRLALCFHLVYRAFRPLAMPSASDLRYSSVLCPPLLPGQSVVPYSRATHTHVSPPRSDVRASESCVIRVLVPSEELSCVSEPLLRYSLAVLAHPPSQGGMRTL